LRRDRLIAEPLARYLNVEPNEDMGETMKHQAVPFPLTSRAAEQVRQSGMLLAITVVWAGLHIMKWAGKPL